MHTQSQWDRTLPNTGNKTMYIIIATKSCFSQTDQSSEQNLLHFLPQLLLLKFSSTLHCLTVHIPLCLQHFFLFFKAKQLLLFVVKNTEYLQGTLSSSQPLLYSLKKPIFVTHCKIGIFYWFWYPSPNLFRKHVIRPLYTMVLVIHT